MCYDKNKWNDARDAILKSAMAIPKYCIVGPNSTTDSSIVEDNISYFDLNEFPESFDHPN
jgi:hypothetical protein